MAQTGTELIIATGGTKIQFEMYKERELKRVSEKLTAQGKEIVNIIEGGITRPLTGWCQQIRIIWKTVDVKPTYTITAPPSQSQPQSQPKPQPIIEKVSVTSDNFNSILDRIDLFLEDKEWDKAIAYCESALDFDPKNANIYLKYLLADYKCPTFKALLNSNKQFEKNQYYQKALRFGDEEFTSSLKETILRDKEQKEINRCDKIYNQAKSYMENQSEESYDSICSLLKSIPGYKDADELLEIYTIKAEEYRKENTYNKAVKALKSDSIDELKLAIELFDNIKDFKDSNEQIRFCYSRISELETIAEKERQEREEKERLAREQEEQEQANKKKKRKIVEMSITSVIALITVFAILLITVIIPNNKYNEALALKEQGEYNEAIIVFTEILNKKDSTRQIQECYYLLAEEFILKNNFGAAAINFAKLGDYSDAATRSKELWDKIAVRETVSAGTNHTVGLKLDGTVVAVGDNDYGQCNVSDWTDIIAFATGNYCTVGLKLDGTVVACGRNDDGQCNVSSWTDIVAISAVNGGLLRGHTVGLKSDGTVVAVGNNDHGQCDVSGWTDIVAISAGDRHTVGLKSDGTVVATNYIESKYDSYEGQCDVSGWTDIVAISAGGYHTVGLKSDGTVVSTTVSSHAYNDGQCDVSGWTDIVAILAGDLNTVGLKSNGKVVAVGRNYEGQCNVSSWTDIVAISTSGSHTVGLKSNGTVVATNYIESKHVSYDGQCDVSGWKNVKVPLK